MPPESKGDGKGGSGAKGQSEQERWEEEAWKMPGDERVSIPWYVVEGEAVDVAKFAEKYWKSRPGDKAREPLPGLETVADPERGLTEQTAADLMSLGAAAGIVRRRSSSMTGWTTRRTRASWPSSSATRTRRGAPGRAEVARSTSPFPAGGARSGSKKAASSSPRGRGQGGNPRGSGLGGAGLHRHLEAGGAPAGGELPDSDHDEAEDAAALRRAHDGGDEPARGADGRALVGLVGEALEEEAGGAAPTA